MDQATAQRTLADMNSGKITWDDNLRSAANNALSGGGGGGSSLSPQSAIDEAVRRQQEVIKPAISAYEGQRPEVTQKYEQARTQLGQEKGSLEQRYKDLLGSIKGNQQVAENRQTVTTQNELGRRGITGSSGLAQQEMTNALNPITQQYTTLAKDTGLAQESDIRNITNQIAGLTGQETADQRAISQAIAQLQAGAGQTGIGQGLQLHSQNIEANIAKQAAEQAAKQQAFENALLQMDMQNKTAKTQYDINAPYFKPESSSQFPYDILALSGQFGGNVAGASTPSTPKPTAYPIQQLPDGRVKFSDGSVR